MKKIFLMGLVIIIISSLFTISASALVIENENSEGVSYTAVFNGDDASVDIEAGDMFLLIAVRTSSMSDGEFPTPLTADAILYIDQKTATENSENENMIEFVDFLPMDDSEGMVFIAGGSLPGPTYLGDIGTGISDGIRGDANGDSHIDVADITAVRDHILLKTPLTGLNLAMADVNDDSSVDVSDITKIRDYVLMKIPSLD